MIQSNEAKELNARIIEKAMKKGADGCDVITQNGQSFSLSSQGGNIDKYNVSSSQITGIRIIKAKKVGLSYSESLDDSALSLMIDQALANSDFNAVNEHESIEKAGEGDYVETDGEIFQEDNTAVDDKIALAVRLEKDVVNFSDDIATSPSNGYGESSFCEAYSNHLGTYWYHRERAFQCYTSALTKKGEKQATYGQGSVARSFGALEAEKCIKDAVEIAIPLTEAKSVPGGSYDIIFDTDQLASFIGCFSAAFSGKTAMEGMNREKLGEKIASESLNLQDTPNYKDGFYCSKFDDEGFRRSNLPIIEGGILKNLMHNSVSGHFFKAASTGHGARSPKSPLSVGGTQFVFGPGESSENDVCSGKYIKVLSLMGLHSGTNWVSGEFSLALEGILYNQGSIDQYVKDVTISGNFYELIARIEGVGNIVHASTSRGFFAPTIRFGQVAIAS